MGVKYIKGNVDIIAMVVAQWELTGRLNEIEYRFLLEKVEELHDSLKLIRPNSKFLMNEEVAADGLREFSIDLGGGEESVTDIGESVPADEHSSDSNAEASQPEDNYPVAET